MFERPKAGEKAILVNLDFGDIYHEDNTLELTQLIDTAGFKVAKEIVLTLNILLDQEKLKR